VNHFAPDRWKGLLNSPWQNGRMAEENKEELLSDPDHFEELARLVRWVASQARSGYARMELLRLARAFEYRAARRFSSSTDR